MRFQFPVSERILKVMKDNNIKPLKTKKEIEDAEIKKTLKLIEKLGL